VFCKIASEHYAILKLNAVDYIVQISDYGEVGICGTTLSNWIDCILNIHGDENNIEDFMSFCFEKFNIPIEYPDYEAMMEIERQYLKPLIDC
jgi:hypothetical protein